MTSSRCNQRASSSSSPSNLSSGAFLASAQNPSINEDGNGHGCEAQYRIASISRPVSSLTSRRTASSKVSPGSTKPASADIRPGIQWRCRASRHWLDPLKELVTSMSTTGSVRGKCCVAHTGSLQTRACPPWQPLVGLPQIPQNRCRRCQDAIDRA